MTGRNTEQNTYPIIICLLIYLVKLQHVCWQCDCNLFKCTVPLKIQGSGCLQQMFNSSKQTQCKNYWGPNIPALTTKACRKMYSKESSQVVIGVKEVFLSHIGRGANCMRFCLVSAIFFVSIFNRFNLSVEGSEISCKIQ